MSLDVYLHGPEREETCTCPCCDNEHTRKDRVEYYSANITHNLGTMAHEAGIYDALWRPNEVGWTRARDIVEPLRAGLAKLLNDPEHYRQFDSPNGWGTYEGFVPWVKNYLAACEKNPEAEIYVSR